jgi:hypothetical protein
MSSRPRVFRAPTTTGIPSEIFDEIMPSISPQAFVVLCYIARRTYGFRQDSETFSLSQIATGTGLCPAEINSALRELLESGIPEIAVILASKVASGDPGVKGDSHE